MKLRSGMTINNKFYPKGSSIPWYMIYPFFMVHMLMFGGSGFFLAYGEDTDVFFLYMHGGIAIFVYIIFYFAIFGVEQVRWMFTNAALGLLGIYSEIDWILSWFNKHVEDFAWYVHVIPFLYYILYTFLLRQALIDISGARDNESKMKLINFLYVGVSLVFYLFLLMK